MYDVVNADILNTINAPDCTVNCTAHVVFVLSFRIFFLSVNNQYIKTGLQIPVA